MPATAKPRPETPPVLEPSGWVKLHGDVLYRYTVVRVGRPDVAENIVQETFLAALKSRHNFSGRSSERTWLMGILKHKVIDHFRRSSREVGVEDIEAVADRDPDPFDERGRWKVGPRGWGKSPDAAVEARQFRQVLRLCLEGLPERLARVFTLREMDQLDTGEVCKIMGITQTNLGVMLYRARQRLRQCLDTGWFAVPQEDRE